MSDITTPHSLKNRLLDLSKLRFEQREKMRYDDVGDYFGNTIITYDMKDPVINNSILIHEFVEYTLIKSAGIDSSMIDRFDTDPKAPEKHPVEFALYEKFHDMANMIERQFIENLGLDWQTHENRVNTAKVQVALEEFTQLLHKGPVTPEQIAESQKLVEKTFEGK